MNGVLAWARRWARRPGAADHELLDVGSTASAESVRAAYHKLARFAHPDLHRATVSSQELDEITDTFARVSNAYSVMMARLRKAAEKEAKDLKDATESGGAGASMSTPPVSGRNNRPSSPPPAAPVAPPGAAPARSGSPSTPPGAAPARSGSPSTPVQAVGSSRMPVVQFSSGRSAGVLGSTTAPATSAPTPPAPAPTASSAASDGPATSLSSKAMMHYRRAELCLRRGEIVEAKLHLKLAMVTDPQSTFLRKAFEDLERR